MFEIKRQIKNSIQPIFQNLNVTKLHSITIK